jgi:hypothetical protein
MAAALKGDFKAFYRSAQATPNLDFAGRDLSLTWLSRRLA